MANGRDIYGRRNDSYAGTFTADLAKLTFAAGGTLDLPGLLVQQMTTNYTQQMSRVYELGSNNVYYVIGRAAGNMGINRIAGPKKLGRAFLDKYGNGCNAGTNVLQFSLIEGCDAQQGSAEKYTCNFVVITSISLAVSSQEVLVNSGIQAAFSAFEYDEQ